MRFIYSLLTLRFRNSIPLIEKLWLLHGEHSFSVLQRWHEYYCFGSRSLLVFIMIQGGSNMTGTDLCVNKPHCDLERVKPQPPPSLLLGLEPVQSCLGVTRVMSEQ